MLTKILKLILKLVFYACLTVTIVMLLLWAFFALGYPAVLILAAIMLGIITYVLVRYFRGRKNVSAKMNTIPKPASTYSKAAKYTFISIIILIGGGPLLLIGGFAVSCQNQRNKVNKDFDPVLKQFDSVYFIDKSTKPVTSVSTGGDCFDSRPWVSVRKTQTINLASVKAIADIDQALAQQGYSIDRSWLNYKYSITDEDVSMCDLKISTQIVSNDPSSPYKTFPLFLKSNARVCDKTVNATKNYDGIYLTTVTLSAQKD